MSIQKIRMKQAHGARERQIKLIAVSAVILGLTVFGAFVYVACHFIIKYW